MIKCTHCHWDKLTFNPSRQQKELGYRHYYIMDAFNKIYLCENCYFCYRVDIRQIEDKYFQLR